VRQASKLDLGADLRVADLAAEQWGVVSARELLRCGLTPNAIKVRARNGRLRRLHRGVYAVGHRGLVAQGRFLAAVKACGPTAVLSHLAAGFLWEFIEEEPEIVDVTVTRGGGRAHGGVRVHRSFDLRRADIARRAEIPLTTPVRTLADLAATMGERQFRHLVRRAQARNRVRLVQLAGAHRQRRGWAGNARLGRVISEGVSPTRTELEDLVLDLLLDGGFERPEVNVPIRLGARLVIPDFRWPSVCLVIEADGGAWHDNPIARADDIERQRLLEAHGERVLRVNWRQAVLLGEQTLARVAAAGAPQLDSRRAWSRE
jgi:hypothetical protein